MCSMVSSFHWKLRGTAHSPLFFVFFPIVKGIATSIVLDSLKRRLFPGIWMAGDPAFRLYISDSSNHQIFLPKLEKRVR